MGYVTIKDIAEALGISTSTVSRAMTGDTLNVSKKTVQRVMDMAEKMGYVKNDMAVNLRSRSTKTIGIVAPESVTSFYMQFSSCVQRLLLPKGYRVLLALSDEDPLTERYNIEMFDKFRVDGLIISPCHDTENLAIYNAMLQRNIPLVFFDRTIANLDCSSVRSDDYKAAFFLMEHLIYCGYRNIVHLTGPKYIRNTRQRLRAYCDTLAKHNIAYDADLVIEAGVDERDGAAAMRQLLSATPSKHFDAVFCFTEMQALGAKKALQEYGRAIPGDVAVACMSGTRLATLVHPSITSVEQSVQRMAEEAVRLLLQKIEDPKSDSENIVLEADMILRDSTLSTPREE